MLNILAIFFLFIFSGCAGSEKREEAEPKISDSEINNFFSQMTKVSSEIRKESALSWDDYYIIKNVDSIYQADIVIFGDRHTSVDVLNDFIVFGEKYFTSKNGVALFEDKKVDALSQFINAWEYVLSRLIILEKFFEGTADNSLSDKIDLTFKKHRPNLASSVWENIKMSVWDLLKYETAQGRHLSYDRNGELVKQLKKYASKGHKVLVFAGSEHIPQYQIAAFKWQMGERLQGHPEILSTKSVGQFFNFCKSLPSNLQISPVGLQCNATENIWSYLVTSDYKFALIAKKRFTKDIWPEWDKREKEIDRLIPNQF